MRRFTMAALALTLAAAIGTARPAAAVIGVIDRVPAATLLLPLFQVDLSDPEGLTTLFSINNASATAVLAHVVLWSDLSVPVLDFNVYLTGYDLLTVNLRDILISGRLPQTASASQDPNDTISPKGAFSEDVGFASCTGVLPPPPLPAAFIAHLQAALTGNPDPLFGGLCFGQSFGSDIALGYITVDTVSNCTLRFPGDVGYFASGGAGDATNQNVLWGDYIYVDPVGGSSAGQTLVAIEASGTDPLTTTSGRYTFYGRYVGWTAIDNREPLPTNFATRYMKRNPLGGLGGTCLLLWRDSKVAQGPFDCNGSPPWFPLGQEQIVIFDEQEHPFVPTTVPVSPQPPQVVSPTAPAETQCSEVGGDDLPVPFDFGWLYLDLNTTVAAAGGNPSADPAAAQAWVASDSAGAAAGMRLLLDGVQLDNASHALHAAPGPPPP
jgi:hypothetical protein